MKTSPDALPRRRRETWTGGAGVLLWMLLPKCPLCWMLIAGSLSLRLTLWWTGRTLACALCGVAIVGLFRRCCWARWREGAATRLATISRSFRRVLRGAASVRSDAPQ